MIGSSKTSRENYPRKCFWTQEEETRVKFNPGLSANRLSNNWAQESIIFLRDRRPAEKVTEESLKRAEILARPRVCRLLIPGEGRDFWWSSYVVL